MLDELRWCCSFHSFIPLCVIQGWLICTLIEKGNDKLSPTTSQFIIEEESIFDNVYKDIKGLIKSRMNILTKAIEDAKAMDEEERLVYHELFVEESESLVQIALSNLMQNRTVVVIAHRLSTIRRATRIAVIEDGRITAIAPHEELLTLSPTYQRLNQLQFMSGIEDSPTPPTETE